MKKLILSIGLMFCLTGLINAQIETLVTKAKQNNSLLGIRIGSGFGYGAEISYQQPIGSLNRIEIDMGINQSGYGLSALYQWVWDLSELGDGFS